MAPSLPTPDSLSKQTDFRKSIDAQTKRAVSEALAEIPPGQTGALIVIADQNGARAQMAWKINDRWKVANEVGSTWHGKVEGRVAVVGSW